MTSESSTSGPATSRSVGGLPPVDYKHQLELLRWLIERHDNLRGSTANRAAIILSAAGILAAVLATVAKDWAPQMPSSSIWSWGFGVSAFLAFGLLVLTIYYCLRAIVTLRPSNEITGQQNSHARRFFNAKDTLATYPTVALLTEALKQFDDQQAVCAAANEMHTIYHLYRSRYERLRLASIRFAWALSMLVIVVGCYYIEQVQ